VIVHEGAMVRGTTLVLYQKYCIKRPGASCSRAFRLDLAGGPETKQVATGRRHVRIVPP
jgi:hypothetical protein